MVGRPRYRTRDSVSGFVRCGFEFDGNATEGFKLQCSRIADYIANRTGGEGDALMSVEVQADPQPALGLRGAFAPKNPSGKFLRTEPDSGERPKSLSLAREPEASDETPAETPEPTTSAPNPQPAPEARPDVMQGGFRVVRRDGEKK